ncbi:MAG: FHA domain-containing protein [Gemmataceae bacterium]|nr:FHA domain-containing protein [Gemmataceae bacterium]
MASISTVLAGHDERRPSTLGSEPMLFGRSRAANAHLTDPHVSRVHCQLVPEGDGYVLIDFEGSGTFANGKEIDRRVLQSGHLLLRIYGAGKTGDHCWVATEYIAGDSLAAVIGRIERAGKLDWKLVLRVGIFLARALEFAHSRLLIHQNITPQNIIVGKKAQSTKLTDLMLAHATEEDPTKPISAAGVPSESLPYMSPERTDGPGASVDARTDIYSLSAVLYAMLTGKPPFQGETVDELIEKIRLDGAPRLRGRQSQVPDSLEKLLRQCLAKRAQDRVPTAAALREQLEKVAATYGIQA